MKNLQVMDTLLNIQQMVTVTGLSAHTLRYYERAGLMKQHVTRDDANGYRYYTQEDVSWVTFIKCLRATGMPIRDIQRYTELLNQGDHTTDARMQLLKEHRQHIEQHLNEVERHLSAINQKILRYEDLNRMYGV